MKYVGKPDRWAVETQMRFNGIEPEGTYLIGRGDSIGKHPIIVNGSGLLEKIGKIAEQGSAP